MPGSLRTAGGLTPSAGTDCRDHPHPRRPRLRPGRAGPVVSGGVSWCFGVHGGAGWWHNVARHQGLSGTTIPPRPVSQLSSRHRVAGLAQLCACIYLFTGEIPLAGPGVCRPGRNIPETHLPAPALRWDHRHSVAVLADPTCHAHPPAMGILVPGGLCPHGARPPWHVWLGAGSLLSHQGTPWGGEGT